MLTDGHPDDPEGTIEECQRIRRTGGRIITVGVGRQVQQDYLRGSSCPVTITTVTNPLSKVPSSTWPLN